MWVIFKNKACFFIIHKVFHEFILVFIAVLLGFIEIITINNYKWKMFFYLEVIMVLYVHVW